MVIVRYIDRAQIEGFRYSVFKTVEEATAQVVHDAAREGRPPTATFHEGERVEGENGIPTLRLGDALDVGSLTAAIRDERARLEKGQDAFVPAELLARLTRSQIDALKRELAL